MNISYIINIIFRIMNSVNYYFVFKDMDSSCGRVKVMVFPMENPSKNSLKRKVKDIIDNSKEARMNLALLEAFPVTENVAQNLPKLSRHTKNEHLYKYEVIMGDIHSDDIIRDTIYECSTAPYLLNEKRIKVVSEEYVQDDIRRGYEILGIAYLGEENFYTEPVSDSVVENSRKSPQNDEYVWVKVKDGDNDSGINWIPARRTVNGEVMSFVGLMFTKTPEEDTRSFTDCPIPGYVITATM